MSFRGEAEQNLPVSPDNSLLPESLDVDGGILFFASPLRQLNEQYPSSLGWKDICLEEDLPNIELNAHMLMAKFSKTPLKSSKNVVKTPGTANLPAKYEQLHIESINSKEEKRCLSACKECARNRAISIRERPLGER